MHCKPSVVAEADRREDPTVARLWVVEVVWGGVGGTKGDVGVGKIEGETEGGELMVGEVIPEVIPEGTPEGTPGAIPGEDEVAALVGLVECVPPEDRGAFPPWVVPREKLFCSCHPSSLG